MLSILAILGSHFIKSMYVGMLEAEVKQKGASMLLVCLLSQMRTQGLIHKRKLSPIA